MCFLTVFKQISFLCFEFSKRSHDEMVLFYTNSPHCSNSFVPLGAELYSGHGGKDTEVSERAQTVPGGRSGGAELLEAPLQRAGGPSQRRIGLCSVLQDAQPPLCRIW